MTDATAGGAKSHLWLTGVDGEDPRRLTYSPDVDKRGEYDGEWMPDGQSILAKRGERIFKLLSTADEGRRSDCELKIKPVVDRAKLPDALPLKDEGGESSDTPDNLKKSASKIR